LIIGVVVVASAGVVGTAIGLIAGYAGGLGGEALSCGWTEVFLAFPALILAKWRSRGTGAEPDQRDHRDRRRSRGAVYARLTRGQILSLRRREFVEAARAMGASRTGSSCVTFSECARPDHDPGELPIWAPRSSRRPDSASSDFGASHQRRSGA